MSWNPALLARVEDASLNASAPPQQRWIDGWLVRFAPGKARRARCIHALAAGRLPLQERLTLAAAVYEQAGLPLHLRMTPFSEPADLDGTLAGMGWIAVDPTRVMLCTLVATGSGAPSPANSTAKASAAADLPAGLALQPADLAEFARAVGALRRSAPGEVESHSERLRQLPVPCRAAVVRDGAAAVACALVAREADLVGLYDVITAPSWRGRGLATWLCERLLLEEAQSGARIAYLQVGADNAPALGVYRRLGFSDGYGYHYRVPPAGSALAVSPAAGTARGD